MNGCLPGTERIGMAGEDFDRLLSHLRTRVSRAAHVQRTTARES